MLFPNTMKSKLLLHVYVIGFKRLGAEQATPLPPCNQNGRSTTERLPDTHFPAFFLFLQISVCRLTQPYLILSFCLVCNIYFVSKPPLMCSL